MKWTVFSEWHVKAREVAQWVECPDTQHPLKEPSVVVFVIPGLRGRGRWAQAGHVLTSQPVQPKQQVPGLVRDPMNH